MAHQSGKNGGVYTSSLLIEDCQDAWNEHTEAGVAHSTTAPGYIGTNCARETTTAVGIAVLASEVIVKNLTAYDAVVWYARSSLSPTAGQLALLLDDHAECVSPLETLPYPALTATVWKQCFAKLSDPSLLAALISVGVSSVADLANGTFDIDMVRALAEIDGIKSWSLEYTASMLDVTDFANSGVSAFIPGITEWHGSFEGYKEGVPLGIGAEVYLVLGETNTAYQGWMGKAIITNARPNVDHDGLVSYSYDFQGTAGLESPSA